MLAATATTTNCTITANSAAGDGGATLLESVGAEFRVNASTSSSQGFATAVMDGVGNYVVVWESSHEGQTSIFGQHFSADGTPRGEWRISPPSGDMRLRPSVAMNAVGD